MPDNYHYLQIIEPSRPFGAKIVAEIQKVGVVPALRSVIYRAIDMPISPIQFTPEGVWKATQKAGAS